MSSSRCFVVVLDRFLVVVDPNLWLLHVVEPPRSRPGVMETNIRGIFLEKESG